MVKAQMRHFPKSIASYATSISVLFDVGDSISLLPAGSSYAEKKVESGINWFIYHKTLNKLLQSFRFLACITDKNCLSPRKYK